MWFSIVVMKIDLVGKCYRGLVMGFNELVGYLVVGIVVFLFVWLVFEYGFYFYFFYLGIVFVVLGLLGSIFLVKDMI